MDGIFQGNVLCSGDNFFKIQIQIQGCYELAYYFLLRTCFTLSHYNLNRYLFDLVVTNDCVARCASQVGQRSSFVIRFFSDLMKHVNYL